MIETHYKDKLRDADKVFNQIKDAIGSGISTNILDKAYKNIVNRFGYQTRISGALSIMHHLWVAKKLADLGFETPVIAAALLHDIVEDTDYGLSEHEKSLPFNERTQRQIEVLAEEFGNDIATLVDAVTEVSSAEQDQNSPHKDWDTYMKLRNVNKKYREAFYIKFADRWHNLSDGKHMPSEKMIIKAADTKRFLLKLAKEIGATEFYNKLGALSLEITNQDLFNKLEENYNRELNKNQEIIKTISDRIKLTFRDDTGRIKPKLAQIRSRVKDIKFTDSTPFIICEHLEQEPKPYAEYRCSNGTRKVKYPLKIIYIIFLDSSETYDIHEMFMSAYKEALHEYLTVVDIISPSRNTCEYFIVQDNAGNLYQIYPIANNMYIQHLYGDIENTKLPPINRDPLIDKPLITVYKKDGTEMKIEKGATILDFAFALHENIGLYTTEASINGNKTKQLDLPLNNGDHIDIISDYYLGSDIVEKGTPAYAKLDWFLKISTYEASKKLVRHFENVYSNEEI